MEELRTIQKLEKLNKVYALDDKEFGTHHDYVISNNGEELVRIKFQKGARNVEGSITGVIDSDLLEIVRNRLEGFVTKFPTEENIKTLEHIKLALMYLNVRVEDRYERNVLGTNND